MLTGPNGFEPCELAGINGWIPGTKKERSRVDKIVELLSAEIDAITVNLEEKHKKLERTSGFDCIGVADAITEDYAVAKTLSILRNIIAKVGYGS